MLHAQNGEGQTHYAVITNHIKNKINYLVNGFLTRCKTLQPPEFDKLQIKK